MFRFKNITSLIVLAGISLVFNTGLQAQTTTTTKQVTTTTTTTTETKSSNQPTQPNTSSDHSGIYVGLEGGFTSINKSSTTGPLGLFDFKIGYDLGFQFGGVVGYDFNKYFRAEFEMSYKQANVDSLKTSFLGIPINLPVSGKIKNFNFMGNAYFQYPISRLITPYVGFGLGLSHIRGTGLTLNLPLVNSPRSVKDTVFAYQVIVGVGFNLTDNITVGADYRFFNTAKGDFKLKNVVLGIDIPFKAKLQSHNFMVSMRYRF